MHKFRFQYTLKIFGPKINVFKVSSLKICSSDLSEIVPDDRHKKWVKVTVLNFLLCPECGKWTIFGFKINTLEKWVEVTVLGFSALAFSEVIRDDKH